MSTDAIEAWKCHQLRAVNQDLSRQELLQDLPANSVYILTDWAMKWLPEKYMEPQEDFFPKRGLSWHIGVVVKKVTSTTTKSTQPKNTTGKHRRQIERSSMRDMGMTMYHSKLEKINNFSSIGRDYTADDDDTIRITPDRGWALPKERKLTRLNESQIKYLTEKFDEDVERKSNETKLDQKKETYKSHL
ncbi:unnamed protein product [Didymodactylos carnosus]|uniref:Uncharacterized protein n=1 Tax=Didymodactylos carnosus TaxID=1234261 RepID=A0A815WDY5_9BILA|nr:unnamed protein product [Didymodactylos carnosus]CAF4404663.1 unnamed protein product [Didymodactylos carnosus]